MTVLQNQFGNDLFEIKQADSSPHRVEVVFVDSRVSDAENLLAGLSPDCTAVFIDAGKDGLSQMADYLSAHPGADAVHILAHGSEGNLLLGSTFLDSESIKGKADDLSNIGGLLSENGDILIYSCGFGSGDKGAALVGTLAALTGADVAASDDRTGKGGDWDLEIRSGKIDSDLPFSSQAFLGYDHDLGRLPMIFTVTNSADSGAGSLRQAISDALDGDTITFASGVTTINLTTKASDNPGVNDDSVLVINKGLTIDGDLDNNGTPDVVLDAGYNGRVLRIESGTVVLDGLTLTNGLLSGNGGNFDSPGGSALGAAIYNNSNLTILNSNITGNTATGGGGGGGGVSEYAGRILPLGALGFGGGGGSGIDYHGGAAGGDSKNAFGAAGANGNGGGGAGVAAPGYDSERSYTPANGSAGGTISWIYNGNNNGTLGGDGGTSSGGHGGDAFIFCSGGNGGSVTGAGGGGGGAGIGLYGTNGGSAVGGIYNIGTLNIASTNFTMNQGAGGGGGGGGTAGSGGTGTGAVYNEGTLSYNDTNTNFTSNLGAGGFQRNDSDQAESKPDIAGPAQNSSWDQGPYVKSVTSSTADGRYNAAGEVSIQVVFSENVTVAGTPTLTLETGTTDRVVDYLSGSGTDTLTFKYTVQAGETSPDLDYANINALELNGGTIKSDSSNVDAICNLPSPGMANSLGANKAIAIGPAASITAPGTFSVTEDVSADIAGISFADTEAGDSIETATLSVNSGSLTAITGGNVTVGGTAQALTLTGKISDINAFVAANKVSFTTDQDATNDVSLGLELKNNGGAPIASKTATITVTAVNDAPVNNVPATHTVMAGGTIAFSSANNNLISVTDVDAGDSQNMTVEVRSTGGTLSWFTASDSDFLGAQAKLSTLNQFYLSSLSFTPDSGFTGQASITITANDKGNTGIGGPLTDIDTIIINVDGTAPTLAASGSTPADNATGVNLTASPQIKLSENIKFGTSGSIELYNVTTSSVVETFNVATAQGAGNGKVSISGDILTVNPTADLALNTEYAIKISGDAIKDIPGNSFAGILDNTTYNFKTDFAPVITSNGGGATAAVNVAENILAVTTVTSTDSDPGQITLYSITGGADASKFSINAGTGVLTFRSAPDFETPQDANSDNIYVVEVTADDANGGRDLQAISVTVTDVNDNVTPPPQPPAPPQPPQPQPNVIPPVNQWGNYPDNDRDGIPETVEKLVPGLTGGVTGDGNGDGIQDTAQKGVSSIPFDYTAGNGQSQTFLTLVGGAEAGKIKDDAGQPVVLREVHHEDAPANLPSDVSMPFGMISFKADAPSAGSSVGFSIYVDGSVPVNGYWKQDKNGNWANLASSAMGGQVITEGGKTRLDFMITDGGIFDKDGKADGVITDPGAPGWRDVATSFDENYYLESKLAALKADGYTQYTTTQQIKDGIIQAGLTVLQYFQLCSLKEGTNPNQFVNTAEYLQAKAVQLNQAGFGGRTDWSADDVKNGLLAAGFTNVVDHFKSSGWLENINPSNRFDISDYLKTNGEARGLSVDQIIEGLKTDGLDPLEHYVKDGQNKPGITVSEVSGAESVRTSYVNTSVFNENYYLQSKYLQLQSIGVTASIGEISAGIANSGMTLLEHFQKYSLVEGTDPNQFFDTSEYLQAKADQMNAAAFGGKTNWTSANVKSSMLEAGYTNAMDHFKTYGWLEDVNPSSRFDVSTYLETWAAHSGTTVDNIKSTFKQEGFDPVTHYLNYGQNESGISVRNAASRSFGTDKTLTDDSSGLIYGGTGNDVFVSGSGSNAISDQGGIDTLRFDAGITKDSIALFKTSSGTDLIWDMGGSNQIKILNQTSAASAVEEFVTKDGYWLSSTDVNKVLQDMTTFASNNGIAMTNINDVRNSPDLMNVINTAWHAPA